MKKFVLAAIAAAAAASFSGSALAVDLDRSRDRLPILSRLNWSIADTTPVKGTTVTTDLGFGVSADADSFHPLRLHERDDRRRRHSAADLAVPGVAAANIVVSSGGRCRAARTSSSRSRLTRLALLRTVRCHPDAGQRPGADESMRPIDATYRLYETAAAAVAGARRSWRSDLGNDHRRFASGVSLDCSAEHDHRRRRLDAVPTRSSSPRCPPTLPTAHAGRDRQRSAWARRRRVRSRREPLVTLTRLPRRRHGNHLDRH